MSVASKAPEPAGTSSPDVLAQNLSWLLSQASHALTTEMTAALEGIGLLPRGHCVLATALTGERTQTELAHLVGLDKTTMVVTLDELERNGLAERRPSPKDRRVRVVAVTDAGRRKAAEADEVVARVQRDVLAALPEDRREALLEGLADLLGGSLATPAACARPVRRRR
jgi:MarR family transcriptional regulator, transcriptional regulator for hemolysin